MEGEKYIHIKNMVCPRCIAAVEGILVGQNITFQSIKLGEVALNHPLTAPQHLRVASELEKLGFELLESESSRTIERIKTLIIHLVRQKDENLHENLSVFLSNKIHREYSSLSRLFSSVEGITIEKFAMRQKIERVKELLFYDEHNLSEIAFEMDYSSVAHLSAQFKKETGMTPTQFKANKSVVRTSIDGLGSESYKNHL